MLELSIPQIDKKPKNVKDIVFTILSKESPLSIIQISNKIRKEYNLQVTYQAARKAIDNLCEKSCIEKRNKKYSIKKEWVLKLKSFFDSLLTNYETKRETKLFSRNLAKEDYAIYTFNNLLDLDNFWGGLINNWARKEKSSKTYYSYVNYHWWLLINLGSETKLFKDFKEKKIKPYCIFRNKNPLNHWAKKIYENLGAITTNEKSKNSPDPTDINLIGDTIIQVTYEKRILDKISNVFQKYDSIQEIDPKEIAKLAHEPGEIKLMLIKNKTISKSLRETYSQNFK
jgi:hypothetical protein